MRWAAFAASLPLAALFGASVYFYITFGQLIDARLHGERDRTFPRVFARPLELRRGQSLSDRQLIDRLNDLGYAQTAKPEKPGEFAVATGAIAIMPRGADFKGQLVRVTFQKPPAVVEGVGEARAAAQAARSRRAAGARHAFERTADARHAGAHVAHQRRAREAPPGSRSPRSRRA